MAVGLRGVANAEGLLLLVGFAHVVDFDDEGQIVREKGLHRNLQECE